MVIRIMITRDKPELIRGYNEKTRISNSLLEAYEKKVGIDLLRKNKPNPEKLREFFKQKLSDKEMIELENEAKIIRESYKMIELRVTRNNSNNSKETKFLDCAGGIILQDDLVYEPLGCYRYLYKKGEKKGISQAYPNPENKTQWLIKFDEETYYFNNKPLNNLLFKVPSDDEINYWLDGIYPIKSGLQLKEELLHYFRMTLDLIDDKHYYHPTIITLQSWLRHVLRNFIYIGFTGKFGGGKTIALESVSQVSYHGFVAGDITQAGTARLTHQQKLSLFADELDVASGSKDNEIYKTFRQGYRTGGTFVRLKERSYEAEIFDVAGTKGYTSASDVEKALKQRTLQTPLRKTKDKRLPIINMNIIEYGSNMRNDLFFYYIENIVGRLRLLPTLPLFPITRSKDINQDRQEVYNEIIKGLDDGQITFLNKFTGRNAELSYNIIIISKFFDIDLSKDLIDSFVEKEAEDELYDDDFRISILKDCLFKIYESLKQDKSCILDRGTHASCFYYPKNLLYDEYRKKLKEKDMYIGFDKFKKYLLEIGFQDTVTIKRERFGEKNLLCLIYDKNVCDELEIKEPSDKSE